MERTLRQRILEQSGLDFLQVKLDPSWHLQGDLHPDARAAHAIAMAIAAKLRSIGDKRPDWERQAQYPSQ